MQVLNLELSNKYITSLLKRDKPFVITRLGIGAETYISAIYKETKTLERFHLFNLSNNAGIYTSNDTDAIRFCELYARSFEESTAVAIWETFRGNAQLILKPSNKPSIHTRTLEPFYTCSANMIPWSHFLKGKKVLIVSPFVDSIKKQNEADFQIFSDGRKLFLDDQEFVYYKAFNTSAGNHIHKNWIETFEIMCNDISKLDFDVALLGCGGYGLPLCNYIHTDMKKSAIYIGGGLQMMFGVMGNRWEEREYWKDIMKKHNPRFIRPSGDEILKDCSRVENGCYW